MLSCIFTRVYYITYIVRTIPKLNFKGPPQTNNQENSLYIFCNISLTFAYR